MGVLQSEGEVLKMEALKKAAIEALRVAVLAVIPIVIDGLSNGMIDLRLVGISALIALLRFVDKYLHNLGKEQENDILIKGLTRF